MTIKTSRHLTPSRRGSAFRRATCDGRSWFVREIKTHRALASARRAAGTPRVEP
jgi:hypothetical protein